MLTAVTQATCVGLAAMGLLVVIVELRARLDRCLLYAGLSLLLLCMFAGVDLSSVRNSAFWLNFQNAVFCLFPPTVLHYLTLLAGKRPGRRTAIFYVVGALMIPMFLPFRIVQSTQSGTSLSVLYYAVFTPYALASAIVLLAYIIHSLRHGSAVVRDEMRLHLIGCVVVSIAGIGDLFQMFTLENPILPVGSLTIYGAMFLGGIIAYVFVSRIARIVNERREYVGKLQSAYRELEASRGLCEIGRSTAQISHEIKNAVLATSGFALLLRRKGPTPAILDGLDQCVEQLSALSVDVLTYSRSRILDQMALVDPVELVQGCIARNFHGADHVFKVECRGPIPSISADSRKIDAVFVNLLRNALEAGATSVTVRLRSNRAFVVAAIEDNGCGCTAEAFPRLFEPFRSTKEKGNGIGLVTCRSIVSAHSGSLSVTPKNLVPGLGVGMIFCVCLRRPEDQNEDLPSTAIVSEGLENTGILAAACRNVGYGARFVDTPSSLAQTPVRQSPDLVLAAPAACAVIRESRSRPVSRICEVRNVGHGLFMARWNGEENVWTEEELLRREPGVGPL